MRKALQFFLTLYFILGFQAEIVIAADNPSRASATFSSSSQLPQRSEEGDEEDDEEEEEEEEDDEEKEKKGRSLDSSGLTTPVSAASVEVPQGELSDKPEVSTIQQEIYVLRNDYPRLLTYLVNVLVQKAEKWEIGSADLKPQGAWFLKTMSAYPDVAEAFRGFLSNTPVPGFKRELQRLQKIPPRLASVPITLPSSSPGPFSSLPSNPSSLALSSSSSSSSSSLSSLMSPFPHSMSLSSSSSALAESKDVSGFSAGSSSWKPPYASESIVRAGDPPFFRIVTKDGDEFYILGSPHSVSCKRLFGSNTLKEIARLSSQKAVLYTEHDLSNANAVEYWKQLQQDSSKSGPSSSSAASYDDDPYEEYDSYQDERKKSVKCYPTVESDLKKYERVKLLSGVKGAPSGLTLENAVNSEPWLGALLLTTHASVLRLDKGEGTEDELERDLEWRQVRRLEALSPLFDIQRKNAEQEVKFNQSWAKQSLQTIISFESSSDSQALSALLAQERLLWTNYIRTRYKWDYSLRAHLRGGFEQHHKSIQDRNELWVKTLLADLVADKTPSSISGGDPRKALYFIVVGTGHLGGGPGFSFIHMLSNAIGDNIKSLERFQTDGEWVRLHLD